MAFSQTAKKGRVTIRRFYLKGPKKKASSRQASAWKILVDHEPLYFSDVLCAALMPRANLSHAQRQLCQLLDVPAGHSTCCNYHSVDTVAAMGRISSQASLVDES